MSNNESVRCEIKNQNILKVYGISGLKITSGFDKSLDIVLDNYEKYENFYKKSKGRSKK